jgi:hypothetical protein
MLSDNNIFSKKQLGRVGEGRFNLVPDHPWPVTAWPHDRLFCCLSMLVEKEAGKKWEKSGKEARTRRETNAKTARNERKIKAKRAPKTGGKYKLNK